MARPTDLTPDIGDQIARFVRAGNYPKTAARAVGVPERTFYGWMARGRAAEELAQRGGDVPQTELPFWQFQQQVERAEAESEMIAVNQLAKAMPRTPMATLQFLARRFPKRWGSREHRQVELSGVDGGPIQVQSGARERIGAKLQEMRARGILMPPASFNGHDARPEGDLSRTEQEAEQRPRGQTRPAEHKGPSVA